LLEKITGEEYGATPMQIAAKLVHMDQKRKENKAQYMASLPAAQMTAYYATSRENIIASRKYACGLCGSNFKDSQQLAIHNKSVKHLAKLNGVIRVFKDPGQKTYKDKNIAKKRYYCKTCNKAFGSNNCLQRHCAGPVHKKKVAMAKAKAAMSSS
jgi:transposase-like protein